MRSFMKDKRGVSNVIVFVLGLVIVTVIVANVFLWNFEMNQLDWEKMQEDIDIVDVTSIIETWSYNPSGYALGGSTTKISGGLSNLTSDDDVYMTFRSYYSGTDTSDFVDETCDLYPPSAKGTHGNFSAQQAGPDSIYDTLTESGEDTEITITVSWGADVGNNGAKYPDDGSDYVGHSGTRPYRTANKFPLTNLPSGATVTKVEVIFRVSQQGSSYHRLDIHPYDGNGQADPETDSGFDMYSRCAAGTEYVNDDTSCRTTGVKTIDLGSQACTDAMSAKSAVNRFSLGWHEEGDNSDEARLDEYTDATNPPKLRITFASDYQLDLEVQWINADYTRSNEELCIKTGTFSGSEDIQVKVRSGSSWIWVMNLTASQWNNISVASYLTSDTFTIQFLGGTETSDVTQDSWDIDVTLLHVWSDQYIMEVEFTGSSNTEDWTQLNWTIESAWTVGSVAVTLQLYNYTLDGYPTSGNGYMSYTSSAVENTDETKKQTITVNPTHFRNTTGYWKMKVKGIKSTDTQFDFKADWIEFKAIKAGGTRFTFENTGSLTCHLVSLWIIDSTVHQHYDIDVFINSGNTYSYVRDDINLPDGQSTVKVVTERGNMEVYSIG